MGYSSSDIEVLEGLEAVRRRPGMYTDLSSIQHITQEVVDNSVDEALAGHATFVDVTIHKDGSVSVVDDGRGMPVDLHPEKKRPGVEVILSTLHAGGKFSAKNYAISGGLHGVGISVVNALSKRVEITIKRDGADHFIAFENGDLAEPLKKTGVAAKGESGTTVHFWPDASFFDSAKIPRAPFTKLLRAKAVLCPNLKITLNDEADGSTQTFHYPDGLRQYLLTAAQLDGDYPQVFVGSTKIGPMEELEDSHQGIDVAIAWGDDIPAVEESYVNLVPTPRGGTHMNGLRAGMVSAINTWSEAHDMLTRGIKLAPEDVMGMAHVLLSAKLSDPQFAGQTKERLSSREAAHWVGTAFKHELERWFAANPSIANQICLWAIERAKTRSKAARVIERKKVTKGPALPGKLADCSGRDLSQSELFVVEGDSAGGSAKQARDRTFQAILPLRGKVLNTWEVESGRVLGSSEIHDLAVAIGCDPGSDDLSGLRYGKICILADADSDGLHIASLICALMVRHFPALVRAGHLYVAQPPLYRIDVGKKKFYALSEDERDHILEKEGSGKRDVSVTRFKGLGEMDPSQLRETTLDPSTRRLIQLRFDAFEEEDVEAMDLLLNKKRAADRKAWIEQGAAHGDGRIINDSSVTTSEKHTGEAV